jgi:hypothetical protein
MRQAVRSLVMVPVMALMICSSGVFAQREAMDTPDPIAKRSDIYCTGYISELPLTPTLKVVGGEMENHKQHFSEGDMVFLNKGREQGVHSGAVYYIIRPLGEVKHPFTKKKMGTFVRELGLLRVIEVQANTSTAEITLSCDTVEFGDLLKPYEEYLGPESRDARPLPRYSEGTGGTKGRIIMSRNYREYLAANQIVYIDLGTRQGVQPGDYFTIFRRVGNKEGVTDVPEFKINMDREKGYESDRYRGGDFSISSTRESKSDVIKNRPAVPRKVLGELIVLKVDKGASVALITRTTAEVNIGDFIELFN